MLELLGQRRVGDIDRILPTHNQGIGRLAKEKGRLACIRAHFRRMVSIVSANAIDTANREQRVITGHRQGNLRRRRKNVIHDVS